MISIIIPIYNAEITISRCLDSIISQSYSDWEVICIDDGSTDQSGSIIDDYAKKDVRIKVYHKQNGGVSSARNVGLENAIGSWITFADADDWFEPSAFVDYLTIAEKYNADIVRAGYIRHFEDGRKQIIAFSENSVYTDLCEFFCILERHEHYSWLWTMMIRRECIGNVRFNERINYLEDHIFSYQCYFNCRRMAVLAKPLYNYVVHQSGSLSTCNCPYILVEAAEQEFVLKTKLVAGKDINMQKVVDDCYLYHLHAIVRLLYSRSYSYEERFLFSTFKRLIPGQKYKEEKIFYNNCLPFFIKDIVLIGLTWLRKIR